MSDFTSGGPVQSRSARMEGARRETGYEGMQVSLRPTRPFRVGARSAHFDTLFAYYIDLVNDPSRAKQRDPDVHNRMRQDLQVLGCLNVRKLATVQLKREWLPARDTPEHREVAAKFEGWFNNQYRISETLCNMLDAILDGISIHEMVWESRPDYSFGIHRMFPTYKDRFVFTKDGRLCLRTRWNVFYGDEVHPWQFVKHVYNVSGGAWSSPQDEGRLYWGQGLEDSIYPNYFFKTVVMNLYTRWLQRLSGGVLIARYPERNPEGLKNALELIEAYQEDEELAYPYGDEYSIEIKEATRAPSDTYLSFVEYMDRQISKAFLGSTLIIDPGDVGTQSLGQIHERTTFGRITEFDRIGLTETINSEVVPVMGAINHVPRDLWPRFDLPLDETSPAANQMLESFAILQRMGYDVSMEMVSEKTGFRRPKPGETLLHMPMDGLLDGSLSGSTTLRGDGPESAGGRFDFSSPEGLERFRTVALSGSHNGRGRKQYRLGESGIPRSHSHSAELDPFGNGSTTRDSDDGHYHEIRSFRCLPSDGHSHEVLVNPDDMDRVIRSLTL